MTYNFWKLVFNVWGVLLVLMVLDDLSNGSINLFNLTILGFGIVGLYGLAFNKAVASQRFWRIFFIGLSALSSILIPLGIISMVLNLYGPDSTLSVDDVSAGRILFIGFYFAMYGFLLRGLFLYTFRRDALWVDQDG
ncbi:hypothetical protein ACFL2V_16880 [Pseudomonadota bacterium]